MVIFHHDGTSWGTIGANVTPSGSNPYTVSVSRVTTFSPFIVTNASVLPIEMTQIAVKADKNQNYISWQTLTEQNTSHFDIQRTKNGQSDWQTLATLKAAGNSNTTKDYHFIDNTPLSINHYRVRSVDFDGKETLSNIVSTVQKTGQKLIVSPNPVSEKLFIRSDTEGVQVYTIFDIFGKLMQSGNFIREKDIVIQDLPKGIYLLHVGSEVVRFVKN